MLKYLVLLFLTVPLYGQQDPHFTKFEGKVVKIPARHCMKAMGYGDHIKEYEVIGNISWDEINIPNTNTSTPFPDVDRKDRFGMVLESDMYIAQPGCYNFVLKSDDGSRFWIDDQEIIDNDGVHGMKVKANKTFLSRGKYRVKIWYHQAFIHKYGFIFDSKYLGANCEEFSESFESITTKAQSISLANDLLFSKNSFVLSRGGKAYLKEFFEKQELNFSELKIKGYTCDLGSALHNRTLSQKRAEEVRNFLLNSFELSKVKILAIGYGESLITEVLSSEEERSKMRRVEIEFK